MPSCAAMAPMAQHRGGDAQLACDLDQRPTAARQQGDRLSLELIRKMTPFLAHSTPFRSHRSLSKVSTNSGEAHDALQRANVEGVLRAAIAGALALELAMRFLIGLGFLERGDLRLGQQDAILCRLGFERFEALLH